MGGKNSIINKPLGAGSGSVNKAVTNVVGEKNKKLLDTGTRVAGGALIGGALGAGAGAGGLTGAAPSMGGALAGGIAGATLGAAPNLVGNVFGGKEDPKLNSLSAGDVERFLEKGEKKGEILTGSTLQQEGEGRKLVKDKLKETLRGESAGANALKQDQAQQQKMLRANQAVSGGGQMSVAQQQAFDRQAQREHAAFVSQEKRQNLSDLSREYRGDGADIMQSSGQYGAILVGSQPPAQMAQRKPGVLGRVFGGLV